MLKLQLYSWSAPVSAYLYLSLYLPTTTIQYYVKCLQTMEHMHSNACRQCSVKIKTFNLHHNRRTYLQQEKGSKHCDMYESVNFKLKIGKKTRVFRCYNKPCIIISSFAIVGRLHEGIYRPFLEIFRFTHWAWSMKLVKLWHNMRMTPPKCVKIQPANFEDIAYFTR